MLAAYPGDEAIRATPNSAPTRNFMLISTLGSPSRYNALKRFAFTSCADRPALAVGQGHCCSGNDARRRFCDRCFHISAFHLRRRKDSFHCCPIARARRAKIVLHALCIPLIQLAWIGGCFTAKILSALKTRLLPKLHTRVRFPSPAPMPT